MTRDSGPAGLQPADIAGIVACVLAAVLAAFVTVLLTPLYWGSVVFPVSVVLAVAANIVFPMLVRQLGAPPIASALPFAMWLIVVIVLGTSRPEGDVLLPAGSGAQPWVTYGMLATGALAGGITVARLVVARPPARQPEPGPARDAAGSGRDAAGSGPSASRGLAADRRAARRARP